MEPQRRATHLGVTAIAVAALAISLSFVATANAFEDPPVKVGAESANLESSAQYLLENSPRKISGIEPTAASEALYETATAPPPGADALVQDELATEVPSLLQKVGAWSWSKVPELAVGAAAGYVGWEIGSAIWGTFFEEASEAGGASFAYPADRWLVVTPGAALLEDGTGAIYSPSWGMRGYNHWYGGSGDITTTGTCELELYGAGTRLFAPGWILGSGCGSNEYRHYVLWKPFEVVRCNEGGVTCPGIELPKRKKTIAATGLPVPPMKTPGETKRRNLLKARLKLPSRSPRVPKDSAQPKSSSAGEPATGSLASKNLKASPISTSGAAGAIGTFSPNTAGAPWTAKRRNWP